MRSYPKYKNLYQSKKIVLSCVSRVLQFKKTKWALLQKLLLNFLKRKKQSLLNKSAKLNSTKKKTKNVYCYKNAIESSIKVKGWLRLKLYHKNFFYAQTLFKQMFGDIKPIAAKRKQIVLASDYCFHHLVKPYFRIDILLWKLNFFCTVYQARQSIKFGEICINNCVVKSNLFVKKGDIISFFKKASPFLTISQSFVFKQTIFFVKPFFTFVELDYYNKQIVIVKDLSELNHNDFSILSPGDVDLKMLKPFI